MPENLTIVTSKRTLSVYGYIKMLRQLANDQYNEWGVDRILVFNTLTPSTPPLPEEIAAIVLTSEFKGIFVVSGGIRPV